MSRVETEKKEHEAKVEVSRKVDVNRFNKFIKRHEDDVKALKVALTAAEEVCESNGLTSIFDAYMDDYKFYNGKIQYTEYIKKFLTESGLSDEYATKKNRRVSLSQLGIGNL